MNPRRPVVALLLLALVLLALVAAPAAQAAIGFLPGAGGFQVSATREGGSPETRAGSHPQALSMSVNFNLSGEPGVPVSDGDLKDLRIELPPGLIENPSAVPKCTLAQFHTARVSPFEASLSGESCPDRTQIGVVEVRSSQAGGSTRSFGVFNLQPFPGAPSELGFSPYGVPIAFVPEVRQADGEYGLTLVAREIPPPVDVNGLTLTIWGNPWGVVHDAQRGNCLNALEPDFGWAKCSIGRPITNTPTAYLTMPTSCEGPLSFVASATSWQAPTSPVSRVSQVQGLEGCNLLRFEPRPAGVLTDPRASSPSGFDFNLDIENEGFLRPGQLATSAVKKAVVQLPDGMTINPSVGAGLGVCTPEAFAAETATSPAGAGCPNDSKIGEFDVRTPLFEDLVEGSLFLAAPYRNPFGSLLAVYLVAKSIDRGILVKVAGQLEADPASGRLTATFDNLPQIPYTRLRVHFREGQRSPLATPAACGTFSTEIDLTPWRAPGTVRHTSSPATIGSGIGGGPCPTGTPSFAPKAQAGNLNSYAGAYTPFYLHLTRSDVEQEITSYSTVLPPGLLGKLAGIPACSDAAIEAAKHRGGFEEAERPSCPAASEIGHTSAGYGLGPVLSYAPGGLYLAGPFHGRPFSIVAIDSATVGPFDLGVVVVRFAIKVDRRTAQVSIDSAGSDPIPHIIDGIPIHLRDVRVYVSRPNFTLNPTSCDRFSVSSTLNGSGAVFSNPADDTTATATAPFQAFDCRSLPFAPRLSLRLKGSPKRGSYPSLRAEVRPRPGDANIAAAAVTLPPSEFLAQNHVDTVCTQPQFAREACPAGSVYGRARAFTPLLGRPLEGNVYLRSSENPLPDLVAALRGGGAGIAIDVVGRIDAVHGGLRGRFDLLPDAPVSRFVMKLRGGKHGLIVNSENVCANPQKATAKFIGHNNLGVKSRPALTIECPKQRGKHKHKPKRGTKR